MGGLLTDAWRVEQLSRDGAISGPGLRDRLLEAAQVGLDALGPDASGGPAEFRLAFRELGLAIGLAAVPLLGDVAERLSRFVPLRDEITTFWLDPNHRRATTWLNHRHINEVMLATSLVPDGFLILQAG
jgi:hypothetical protein